MPGNFFLFFFFFFVCCLLTQRCARKKTANGTIAKVFELTILLFVGLKTLDVILLRKKKIKKNFALFFLNEKETKKKQWKSDSNHTFWVLVANLTIALMPIAIAIAIDGRNWFNFWIFEWFCILFGIRLTQLASMFNLAIAKSK